MKDAQGHGSNGRGGADGAAHQQGVNRVGQVPALNHPMYTEAEKPRGYNAQVTPLSADFRTSGQMLRARTDMGKDEHMAAGDEHARLAGVANGQWHAAEMAASRNLGGKDPGPLISGIGSSKYSESEKTNLRGLAREASGHSGAAMAHYAAAGMHLHTAQARYQTNKRA